MARIGAGLAPIWTTYRFGAQPLHTVCTGYCAVVDLTYFRTGSGPPLLLLHPLGLANIVWRPVVPLLAREREVVVLDLPGFGASLQGPHTIEGLAHCLTAFSAGLGLERPHVAGNALGGAIALAMGAAGAARSVCALSPDGFARDREGTYARMLLAGTRGVSRALLPVAPTLARSRVARTALSLHATARPWRVPAEDLVEWGRNYARAAAFWDVLEALDGYRAPTPTCPTTIAWGDRDRLLLFSRHAPRARRMLPDARHVTLRGCGHVPMWDDPVQVARAMLEASA
jgi:pimeloyl-ACP methyl ester carboxylesterase